MSFKMGQLKLWRAMTSDESRNLQKKRGRALFSQKDDIMRPRTNFTTGKILASWKIVLESSLQRGRIYKIRKPNEFKSFVTFQQLQPQIAKFSVG